ncbi:SRPBCC domain-containing protein [Leucobacter zeae]|nr:SRPBCC domain-containing protein [Leucobacter zeae]
MGDDRSHTGVSTRIRATPSARKRVRRRTESDGDRSGCEKHGCETMTRRTMIPLGPVVARSRVKASRADTWSYLVDSDLRTEWWPELRLEPGVGGAVAEQWSEGAGDESVSRDASGAVDVWVEGHAIGFTWREAGDDRDTAVLLTLRTQSGGTGITITETGFDALPSPAERAAASQEGWKVLLGDLTAAIDAAVDSGALAAATVVGGAAVGGAAVGDAVAGGAAAAADGDAAEASASADEAADAAGSGASAREDGADDAVVSEPEGGPGTDDAGAGDAADTGAEGSGAEGDAAASESSAGAAEHEAAEQDGGPADATGVDSMGADEADGAEVDGAEVDGAEVDGDASDGAEDDAAVADGAEDDGAESDERFVSGEAEPVVESGDGAEAEPVGALETVPVLVDGEVVDPDPGDDVEEIVVDPEPELGDHLELDTASVAVVAAEGPASDDGATDDAPEEASADPGSDADSADADADADAGDPDADSAGDTDAEDEESTGDPDFDDLIRGLI